ncbi:YcxB family protein [Clostridium sp. AM58-1XD]|uniref:YcxB family protein n=1 Tax=Clostridium sp. AM58-1XD TaxID=2292307 RepID=UPI000E4C6776|nr:YcxB family protein [Clostridium sp. AM58-1XD]RGY99628.1 hypothetical protein DXA13_07240 [Clostridium sp. AM58-1XD]
MENTEVKTEDNLYFLVRHPYDEEEIRKLAGKTMRAALSSKKSFTVKNTVSWIFIGLILMGFLLKKGLLEWVPYQARYLTIALFGAAGIVAGRVLIYILVMITVRRNLKKNEGRDTWLEFYGDRLVIRGTESAEIPYRILKAVRETEAGYLLEKKEGKGVLVKKDGFIEGLPEQLPEFLNEAMVTCSGRPEKVRQDFHGESERFQAVTVWSERICINAAVAEVKYRKKKRNAFAKYFLSIFMFVFTAALIFLVEGFTVQGVLIIIVINAIMIPLILLVQYLSFKNGQRADEKKIRKSGLKMWKTIQQSGEIRPAESEARFFDEEYLIAEGETVYHRDYGQIKGLYETGDCLYLEYSGIIPRELIDKKGITGGQTEELKQFLEETCGKKFQYLDMPKSRRNEWIHGSKTFY